MLKYKYYSLILIKQGDYYILSQKKHFYPVDFARIIGRSINKQESPKKTALKELQDCLVGENHYLKKEDLKYVANLKTIINTAKGETVINSYIYFTVIPTDYRIQSKNKTFNFCFLKELEFQELIISMSDLKENLQRDNVLFGFNWQDYVKIYQPIQQIALNYAKKLEKNHFDNY